MKKNAKVRVSATPKENKGFVWYTGYATICATVYGVTYVVGRKIMRSIDRHIDYRIDKKLFDKEIKEAFNEMIKNDPEIQQDKDRHTRMTESEHYTEKAFLSDLERSTDLDDMFGLKKDGDRNE